MASSEKLGAASPYVICNTGEISALLVPKTTPADMLADFVKQGVRVEHAG
jgi:hypothetical protein